MVSKKQILEDMARSLLFFGKVCDPEMFQQPSCSFHYELERDLMDFNLDQLVRQAPRGSAKSSIVAGIFVLWHIFLEDLYLFLTERRDTPKRDPKFILIQSKTQGESIRRLNTIKNVLDKSRTFKMFFGHWGMRTAIRWKNNEIKLKDGTTILAVGTGQQVRGLKEDHMRLTLAILDDPEDEENTKTAERMEANLAKFLQGVMPAMEPKRRVIVIGTPQHERCMVKELEKMLDWDSKTYQALIDGKSYWEERYSTEFLTKKRESFRADGRVGMFYREYMCQVQGDEEKLFTKWLLYEGSLILGEDHKHVLEIIALASKVGVKPIKLATPKRVPVYTFMGIDPASSTKSTADYSGIVTVAVDNEDNRYTLPYTRRRMRPLTVAESIIENYRKYRPIKSRIESTGYQEMLREFLRSDLVDVRIPGLEIKEAPRNSKNDRLEGMQPFFGRGKVFLQPEMRELMDELVMYPRGRHDDLMDALFYANKNVYKPWHSADGNGSASARSRRERMKDSDWMLA